MIIFSNRQIISTWEIFNSFVKPSEGNYFRPFDHIIGCLATQIEIKNRFQIYTMELLDYTDSGQHFPKREYLPNWPNHAWPNLPISLVHHHFFLKLSNSDFHKCKIVPINMGNPTINLPFGDGS